MYTFDIGTLFLTLFLVNVVLTLMLFTFWRSQKTHEGFRTWMLSLLVVSCGYFLYLLGGSLAIPLCSTVANILIMLSVMLRLDSTARYFRSKALPGITYAILVPAALLLLWFTFRLDSVVMRGVIIGVFLVPCFVATALIAIRSGEPETRSIRYSFSAALMVTALLWTTITIRAIVVPGDHSLTGPDPVNPIFFLVTILTDIVSTGSYMMLNMARSNSELRDSEERYRNLTDNLPEYIIVHDGQSILYANPAAALLRQPSRETLVGQSVFTFLTPASAEAAQAYIRAKENGDTTVPLREIEIQLPDGTVRHCMIRTVRIEFRGMPAFLSMITDITGRKAAEDALARLNKKLTILSSITRHDIKNQLMALTGYLELSKEQPDLTPAALEYLETEVKIVGIMGRQIDFTKAYEDMGTTAPAWQNVSTCVREAVAALPMRDIRVEAGREDLFVYADPMFGKVFYNLIDNALRYGGGAMTAIRISCHETGRGLVLVCEDDGAGIAIGDKANLFSQGFGKHSGLGLFLSREILAITNITITETGEPGKGARFEMVVPEGAYRFTDERVNP